MRVRCRLPPLPDGLDPPHALDPGFNGVPPGFLTRKETCSASGIAAVRRLSTVRCGAAGSAPIRMLAQNRSKSASLAASRPSPRAVSRRSRVASSDLTQIRWTVPPPSSASQERHRCPSWICPVNGPDSRTGQPCARISRAVAAIPAYSCTLTCSSYHGPSRSPGGRPAVASTAATNEAYIVSLSSSAGVGSSAARSMSATVLFPAPGGPATTQAGAGTLMSSG